MDATRAGTFLGIASVVAVAAGCATTGHTTPRARSNDSLDETQATLDRRIATEVVARKWPDLAVGLVANGKLIWWRGYGEVDPVSHAPVTAETDEFF